MVNVNDILKYKFGESIKETKKLLTEYIDEDFSSKFMQLKHDAAKSKDSLIELYDMKNKDLETSLIVSAIFEKKYFRNAFNFINKNIVLLGKTILDIGCDNGILTCLIALLKPEAKIIGIDPSVKSIEIANELKLKLNINNITFCTGSFEDFKTENRFDTVITSRIGSNLFKAAGIKYENKTEERVKQAALYFKPFFDRINNLLNEHGSYIHLDNIVNNEYLVGWTYNFCNNNYEISDFEYIDIINFGEDNHYNYIIFTKTDYTNFKLKTLIEYFCENGIENTREGEVFYYRYDLEKPITTIYKQAYFKYDGRTCGGIWMGYRSDIKSFILICDAPGANLFKYAEPKQLPSHTITFQNFINQARTNGFQIKFTK